MVKLTMLARVADGLPLAEGLDSDRQTDLEQYKQQAKTLFKKLSQGPPPPSRMSYESGPYFLHYMVSPCTGSLSLWTLARLCLSLPPSSMAGLV